MVTLKRKNQIYLTNRDIYLIIKTARRIFGRKIRIWVFKSRLTNPGRIKLGIYIESNKVYSQNRILEAYLSFCDKVERGLYKEIDLILRPINSTDTFALSIKCSGLRLI